MTHMKSAIYKGVVVHRRLRPFGHLLKYNIFYLLIDLEELSSLDKLSYLLSVNKPNVMSLRTADFGSDRGQGLLDDIKSLVASKAQTVPISSVRLLCIPRLFGYAFNPISTYFCYSDAEELVAVVYEVRNTFGEKHHYVVAVDGDAPQAILKHNCSKEMYVSPFIEMDCQYYFSVIPPAEKIVLSIKQSQNNQPLLNASFSGKRMALTRKALTGQILSMPFNSFKVIAGIHWEALKLWLRGLPLVERVKKADVPAALASLKKSSNP